MDPTALPADATAKIAAMLAVERLDPSYVAFVARHLAEPDSTWRWCCGSNCDPCVQRLGRVVDQARAVLRTWPGGIPTAGQSA